MTEGDKELLHKQAHDQAEKFEVLNKRDVSSMSRVSIPCLTHAKQLSLTTLIRSSEHLTNGATTSVGRTSH